MNLLKKVAAPEPFELDTATPEIRKFYWLGAVIWLRRTGWL
jgi:hypothetical protein